MVVRGDGNVGIGTTSPSAKLDVNGSIKAEAFFTANKDGIHYNATPLECVDVCVAEGGRMATSGEVYAYASTKKDYCGYLWMLDDKNMNKIASGYPMYNNRTTSGCGDINTGDVPRIAVYSDNQEWTVTTKANCACSGIQ